MENLDLSNLSEKALHDYKLVQEALHKGNQKAYADLMGRYRDSVYFMLLKMINNKDDADDLTIEAFGKAFKKLETYTPDFAFSTWLFKIASNNCIDFIRRRKATTYSIDRTYQTEDGAEVGVDLKSQFLDPEEKVMKKQKIKMMHDVVAKLKPKYRTLVELRYFEELSYEEIAVKTGLPLGSVKAQLFRAREFLYNIMKNMEEKI